MSHRALGSQFQGYTGGPEEAYRAVNPPRAPLYPEREVHAPRLFEPESVARPEAHQQTPEQFAKDPRTWFHGRYTAERSRLGGTGAREGFHAGTEGAARQRLKALQGRRASKEGVGGHLFPLRITGTVAGPEQMQTDVTRHARLSSQPRSMWEAPQPPTPIPGGGYLYENLVEAPGSISVGVPRRRGFLSTHREMIAQAQKEGKPVHPSIAWAAKKAPEHTGETYPAERPWTPEGQRHAQEYMVFPAKHVFGPGVERGEIGGRMERTSYETAGGRTQHVWRRRESGPGSALLSRQWEQ